MAWGARHTAAIAETYGSKIDSEVKLDGEGRFPEVILADAATKK